jgi:hypothetical protein
MELVWSDLMMHNAQSCKKGAGICAGTTREEGLPYVRSSEEGLMWNTLQQLTSAKYYSQ